MNTTITSDVTKVRRSAATSLLTGLDEYIEAACSCEGGRAPFLSARPACPPGGRITFCPRTSKLSVDDDSGTTLHEVWMPAAGDADAAVTSSSAPGHAAAAPPTHCTFVVQKLQERVVYKQPVQWGLQTLDNAKVDLFRFIDAFHRYMDVRDFEVLYFGVSFDGFSLRLFCHRPPTAAAADTDSAYIGFARENIDELIRPSMRAHYEEHFRNRVLFMGSDGGQRPVGCFKLEVGWWDSCAWRLAGDLCRLRAREWSSEPRRCVWWNNGTPRLAHTIWSSKAFAPYACRRPIRLWSRSTRFDFTCSGPHSRSI